MEREERVVISDDFVEAMAKEAGLDLSNLEQLCAARTFMNLVAEFCAELCESREDANRIESAFVDSRDL